MEINAQLKNETPANGLLVELNTKMCTVGILCTMLENSDLFTILSILKLPGNINEITLYNLKNRNIYVYFCFLNCF